MNRTLTAVFCVLLALPALADKPAGITPAAIDHLIRAEWNREKTVPAAPVDDARFLRRVYLDIAGVIPPPEAVTAFLADRSPDKRAKAVDALLASPRYVENWTNYWDNVLMGKAMRNRFLDRAAFKAWLHNEFEKNVPWNRFVYDLITATGVNSTGGSYAKAAGLPRRPNEPEEKPDPELASRVNGATNWVLKYQQAPADLSGAASKIFLGVQIQCAQCHDHKTEKWKQEDFRKFTACFMNARPRPVGDMMATAKAGKLGTVELTDVNRPFLGRAKAAQGRNEYLGVPPAAIDGTDFSGTPNRRQALASWMTAPENPWFAEAIVNRMWAHFLGRGFVEPIDDFRESNPGTMPELLKRLADDFVASDYDLKHLIKQITATQVYQLSSGPAKTEDPDNKRWARYRLKPLQPEVMLDSLISATNLGPVLERIAGGNIDAVKFALTRQFTFLFDVDEESEQKDFEGTIPQALMLLNGNLTNRGVSPIPGTALSDVLSQNVADADRVTALYLRTLSRRPTGAELVRWVRFVTSPREAIVTDSGQTDMPLRGRLRGMNPNANPKQQFRRGGAPDPLNRLGASRFEPQETPKQQAYEDLFWALLNSSEFMFNH